MKNFNYYLLIFLFSFCISAGCEDDHSDEPGGSQSGTVKDGNTNTDTYSDTDTGPGTDTGDTGNTDPAVCSADGTPVVKNGQLKVLGTQLQNACGQNTQLRGPSSMWLNWENDGYAESLTALQYMRDNWKASLIRASMGVDERGAYLDNPNKALNQVHTIVDNAIELGMYVIIDWHTHHGEDYTDEAVAFFTEMAHTYGNTPNVLYEPYNEPLQISWTDVLKPYHETVVTAIRAVDPDNIIILGTPQWSQRVIDAAENPLVGTNLMYTLHFYACTHTSNLRNDLNTAHAMGLPLFVTEWGATNADGGVTGDLCLDEAGQWLDLLDLLGISWAAWKLDGCSDLSCILNQGTPVNGPFDDTTLHGHGPFVRDRMIQ